MKNVNNISFGLFIYKGKYRWRNIKDIPILFKRIVFILKHGYSPVAKWETFAWFIDTMKSILPWYMSDRHGSPVFEGLTEDESEKEWNKNLNEMIMLLDAMNENNPLYENWDYKEVDAAMENAKDKFFKLFSKYFYNLWD